ncbi:MAG: protein phosphatase 2C family protein [Verrucomicrobia bacterium]|nr:protein phosphatase 2C family protein [Verrucomicrobiota bacterium]
MTFEHISIIKPARSSDEPFFAEDTRGGLTRVVFGVVDTIGKPRSRQLKTFVAGLQRSAVQILKSSSATSLDELADDASGFLLKGNAEISSMKRSPRDSLFGLCVSLTIVVEKQFRVLSLGDCRTYHVSGDKSQCLTRDHNELASILEREEKYALLQNELSELSRTLTCHWGTPVTAQLDDVFAHSLSGSMEDGDLLITFTDGVYLPVVRSVMDLTNCALTRDNYYLEYWMSRVAAEVRKRHGSDFALQDFTGALLEHCAVSSGFRRKRYRDDIAVVAVRTA